MNSKVEFDNPSNEYYSGSMLRGRVRLMLTEPQFFTIIYVRIHGYGHTEWTEGSGKEKKDFEGDETYIDKTIDLNIREPGMNCVVLFSLFHLSLTCCFSIHFRSRFNSKR